MHALRIYWISDILGISYTSTKIEDEFICEITTTKTTNKSDKSRTTTTNTHEQINKQQQQQSE